MNASKPLIVVVEDEKRIAELLCDYLERNHYRHQWISNGQDALSAIRAADPALVLLDVMLPGKDGMQICRELRAFSDVPVIMVTARVEELDRLLGLELGADDYICKPFSPREVMARIKTVLRRAVMKPARESSLVHIDAECREARVDGHLLDLTPNEFNLLQTFSQHPRRVFSRAQLQDRIYDDGRIVSDRAIDSHIKNLRKKMASAMPGREFIESIYGVGYRYVEDAD